METFTVAPIRMPFVDNLEVILNSNKPVPSSIRQNLQKRSSGGFSSIKYSDIRLRLSENVLEEMISFCHYTSFVIMPYL